MRLDDTIPPLADPATPTVQVGPPRHAPRGPGVCGPGLWGPLFGALWLNASLLAALICVSQRGAEGLLTAIIWALALGIFAIFTAFGRIMIHDALTGLDERERIFIGLSLVILFVLPVLIPRQHILPHGFLWTAPGTLLLCFKPPLARRHLAWMLLGAWFAAHNVHDGLALGLLVGFAVSWLLALGALHATTTGDPHGLRGWWPVRQVLYSSLMTAIPAGIVGGLAWWFWPEELLNSRGPMHPPGIHGAGQPMRLLDKLEPLDLLALLWRGAVPLGVTVVAFIVLLYLRRLYLKRQRTIVGPDIMPGQVSRLEYRASASAPTRPHLAGMRRKIVALWGQWAGALAREELGRQGGETADHYAARLARQAPEVAPPAAMVELLDRAHYGREEPRAEDLAAMRTLVRDEISRLSLQRQKPIETPDTQGSR